MIFNFLRRSFCWLAFEPMDVNSRSCWSLRRSLRFNVCLHLGDTWRRRNFNLTKFSSGLCSLSLHSMEGLANRMGMDVEHTKDALEDACFIRTAIDRISCRWCIANTGWLEGVSWWLQVAETMSLSEVIQQMLQAEVTLLQASVPSEEVAWVNPLRNFWETSMKQICSRCKCDEANLKLLQIR